MKERIIICIVLLAMSYAVCGCKEKPESSNGLRETYLWCQPCQKTLGGTYIINEGYWFQCSTCQTIYTNAQWEKVGNQKYKEMFGVDLIAGQADELTLIKELAKIDEARKLVDLYDPNRPEARELE